MMEDLAWKEQKKENVFTSKVFSISQRQCISPQNKSRTFTVMDAPDWVVVIPVLETELGKKIVMVNQWRHGSECISLEFPGGVSEPGEDPAKAGERELLEETGYKPGKITKLGELSPNPAIMSNKLHVYLAEDLFDTGKQNLDTDEFVKVELVDEETVFQIIGKPPFFHALMAAAFALYCFSRNE